MSIDNAVDAGMSGNSPGSQQDMAGREADHDGESEKLTIMNVQQEYLI